MELPLMAQFDDREKSFEAKFAHDEELQFKVMARRDRLLGLWAAEKLGLEGERVSGDLIFGMIFFAPVLSFFRTLFYCAVFHFFVRFFGGKRDIKNTLSAVAYSQSPDVLSAIPFLGDVIKSVYKPVLWIWGIREAQGLSTARAVLVVILPAFLTIFLLLVFAMMFFSMASNLFVSG